MQNTPLENTFVCENTNQSYTTMFLQPSKSLRGGIYAAKNTPNKMFEDLMLSTPAIKRGNTYTA